MNELTKDDLEFLDRIGAWTHRGLKTKILKNQEDAEAGKICAKNCADFAVKYYKTKEIVERLKKLCHNNRNINGLLDLESFHGKVQKILEKPQRMSSTKEGREALAKYDGTADSW